jgi:hypothetical protein
MSYATAVYAVDLDQLRQTVGSKDGLLSAKLKRQTIFDADEFEGIPIGRAVEELIAGTFNDPSSAHMYGYALQELCEYLGTQLDSDMVGDVCDLELDSPLEDVRHPVALPDIADFPMISSLSQEALAAEVERLGSMDLAFPDDEDIEEARRELLECLKQAAAKGAGSGDVLLLISPAESPDW